MAITEKTNGKWTLANIIISLFTAGTLTFVGAMYVSVRKLENFAARGDRCTLSECTAIDHRLGLAEVKLLQLPPRWLSEKIDRMLEEQETIQLRLDGLAKEQQAIRLKLDDLAIHSTGDVE